MTDKVTSLFTGGVLRALVQEEAERLQSKQKERPLTSAEITILSNLCKAHSVLAAEYRESIKGGIGDLSDADIKKLEGEEESPEE